MKKVLKNKRETYVSPTDLACFILDQDGPEGRTIHPYKTLSELFYEKKGQKEIKDISDSMRVICGTYMEPAIFRIIKDYYCGEKGPYKANIRKGRFVKSASIDRFAGTNDGFITCKDIPYEYILEIKTINSFQWYKNEEQIPLHWIIQLHGYMMLWNKMGGVIAVLIGGNDLRFFHYDIDNDLCKSIRSHIKAFWDYVDSGEQYIPPKDTRYDHLWIKYYWPSKGSIQKKNEKLDKLCEILLDLRNKEKALGAEIEALKADIIRELEDHDRYETPNYVVTFTLTKRGTNQLRVNVNKKLLVENIDVEAIERSQAMYS